MKKMLAVGFLAFLMICLVFAVPSLADVLDVPGSVQVIEQEAFYGDTSLDRVVLHEGIERIGDQAFSGSHVNTIYLPTSLSYIADTAFDRCDYLYSAFAVKNSYAWQWMVDHDHSEILVGKEVTVAPGIVEFVSPANGYIAEVEEILAVRLSSNDEEVSVLLEIKDSEGNPFPEDDIEWLSDGCNLHLKTLGSYSLYIYSENNLLEQRSFTVREPSCLSYYAHSDRDRDQYVGGLPGTALDFHVVFDFMPTKVVLMKDSEERVQITETGRNWEFQLDDVIGVSEEDVEIGYGRYAYTVKAYYGNGTEEECVITEPIDVYCVRENEYKGQLWKISDGMRPDVYYKPDGTDAIGLWSDDCVVIMGDYCFGNYYEASFNGIKGFYDYSLSSVYSDSANAGYSLLITSDLDGLSGIISLKPEQNDNEYEFIANASENIESVMLKVFWISPEHYEDGLSIEYSMISASYTIDAPHRFVLPCLFTNPGIYTFQFHVYDANSRVWIAHRTEQYQSLVVLGVSDDSDPVTMYVQRDDAELSSSPIMSHDGIIATLPLNTQVGVIGEAGNGIVLVSYQNGGETQTGYMRARALGPELNPSVRRALVYVSSDLVGNSLSLWSVAFPVFVPFYETGPKAIATYNYVTAFFRRHGCEIVHESDKAGNRFERLAGSLNNGTTDSNDETFIYVFAHGKYEMDDNGDPILVDGKMIPAGLMSFDGQEYNNDIFLAQLNNIKGKVVVVLETCHSGAVIDRYPSVIRENKNTFTFISSAEASEPAPMGFCSYYDAPPFTKALMELLDRTPMASAQLIRTSIPVNKSGETVSYTQIGGVVDIPFFGVQ